MPAGYPQSLQREWPSLHTQRSLHLRLLHLDPEGQVSSATHTVVHPCTHMTEALILRESPSVRKGRATSDPMMEVWMSHLSQQGQWEWPRSSHPCLHYHVSKEPSESQKSQVFSEDSLCMKVWRVPESRVCLYFCNASHYVDVALQDKHAKSAHLPPVI